jgi:choline-sulfatase
MPARASLLTERYVRDHGVLQNDSEVSFDLPTGPQALREAGYHTAVIGKTHLWVHGARRGVTTAGMQDHLRRYGFEECHETVGKLANLAHVNPYTQHLEKVGLLDAYREHVGARAYTGGRRARVPLYDATPIPLPVAHYVDVWHGQRAAEWIEAYRGAAPFFLFVGFPGPHDPWDAPLEAVEEYRGAEIPLPASTRRPDDPAEGPYRSFVRTFKAFSYSDELTDDRIREARRAYYANVTLIDTAVGRILTALERSGLDDTWVFYTADHGEMMGEHGLLAKMVFYQPAVRIPLIARPPGGAAPRVLDDLVEQFDLSATIGEIAGARPVPRSEARSLLPLLRGGRLAPRGLSITENFGFAGFETDRYKLIVHEDDLTPVSLFDRERDPNEDRDLIADPAARPIVEELMEAHVRPFFRTPPARPHRPLFSRG